MYCEVIQDDLYMYKKIVWFLSTVLTAILSIAIVVAQGACSDLLFEALDAVDQNCSDLGRNEACYGFDQVEVEFLSEIDTATFTQPADITPIADIETIRTAPLNLDTGVWGVAVMNLQANMPDTLPGQNVTFVLMGDVEVENAVAPEDAFDPGEGTDVEISVMAGANIRSGPGSNFNVIGGATYQSTLQADGLSEDRAWLRVAYRERPAWISASVIVENPAIAELPTLSADLYTPMQAIYLRTGIGQTECDEAPQDILLVQGPDNIEISLNVNGANVSLGSSGAFRVIYIDGKPFLEITVFDGIFNIGGQSVLAGQRSVLCLGDESSRGLDGKANDLIVNCEASPPEQIDFNEFGQEWCVLENVPANILNYGIEVLCPGETPPPANEPPPANGGSPSEISGVDCSTLSIPGQSIPANNFTLSWNAAAGADRYIVAVLDENAYEVSSYSTTGTSIGLNGGVGFPSSGSIHVRAYQNGQYACFASIGFTRAPDPGVPPGGYPHFDASFVSCGWPDGLSFTVQWHDAAGGVTIMVGSYTFTQSGSSGTATYNYVSVNFGTPVIVKSGSDSISLSCDTPPQV
jgi:hypothetical protein